MPRKIQRKAWIQARVTGRGDERAYISLPGYRFEPGIVSRAVRLDHIIDDYKGPWVVLDFDKSDTLIGIEIVVFDSDKTEPPIVAGGTKRTRSVGGHAARAGRSRRHPTRKRQIATTPRR
jgi:hypothetical protein